MKALLMPILDSRKSFYGKAIVMKENGESVKLQSYETIVAEIWPERNFELKIYNCQSPTTVRHINEFIYQYAPRIHQLFGRMTKKFMEQYMNSHK